MLENFRLKVFRAVAEHLSFRKAGEQLYLTQPAVTLQIKALEEELGTKLFERSAAGVSLSETGRALLPYAERLRELAEEAENDLAGMKGQVAGSLVLGASTTIAQYVIPAHLAAFSRRFPGVQLQVFGANTERIAEGVASGRFGLGLIEGPALRKDLLVEDWFEDEIFIAVPAGHEWADVVMISPEKLKDAALVMRERGSGSRHVVEQALQKAGMRLGSLHIAMELDSTEAILSCVEAGLGVGFVSKWAMERRVGSHALAALRIDGHRMMRTFSFVLPRGPEPQQMAIALKRFLSAANPR
jgi:LysR family transcriptional regulator, transcriptional activator of the cysJI operon